MQLTRYEKDGWELLINQNTGECFASQNALVRMSNTAESTIRRFAVAHNLGTKRAEIPTTGGTQGARLYSEEEIYKVLQKYNPDFLVQCSKAGLRVYLYQLAGFSLQPVAKTDLELEKINAKLTNLLDTVVGFQNQLAIAQEEIALIKPEAEEYKSFKKSFELLEDLKPVLSKIAEELRNNPDQRYKPLKDWLNELGYPTVSRGKNVAIGKLLTSFLKIGNLTHFIKRRGNSKYPEALIPLLKECYFFTLR